MNKLVVTAAVAGVVLAAGYPASAWFFGKQIEAAHTKIDEKIAAYPYIKLVKHDYVREMFSASEVITLEIPASLFRTPTPPQPAQVKTAPAGVPPVAPVAPAAPVATEPAAAPSTPATAAAPQPQEATPLPPPLRITFKTTITHGPFPGFSDFGAGTAETVIEFDEPVQQKINTAFGGKRPLNIKTRYGFMGGGLATMDTAAFSIALPHKPDGNQATLSGDATKTTIEFTSDMEKYTATGTAPRFVLVEQNGQKITLSGISLESRQQRLFKDEPMLYTGTQKVSLAELMIEPGEGKAPKIGLKDIKYDVDVLPSADLIGLTAKLGAAEIKVGEKNYGPARYDFSFKNFHARKLVAFQKSLMAQYSKPQFPQDPAQQIQALAALKGPLFDLLTDNPEFSIDRISLSTPEGEAVLNASVKLPGARPEDFANPQGILAKLDFSADITAPVTMLTAIQTGTAANEEEAATRKQATEQSIADFVQQGYVINENGTLKTRITFRAKELQINGKPFNPMAMLMAKAQAQQAPVAPQ